MEKENILEILETIRNRKILVVGDVMLDAYVWGAVDRISPEAPIQVVNVRSESTLMGGAANVASNLVGLGAVVRLVSCVGPDDNGRILREKLRDAGVRIQGLITDSGRPTSTKTRVLSKNQQLLRIDREEKKMLSEKAQGRILQYLKKQIPACDGIILSDYGKGVLTPRVLAETIRAARSAGKIVMADPKGRDFSRYRGVTCLTPNRKEAEEASGRPLKERREILSVSQQIRKDLKSRACLITLGEDGMALFDGGRFMILPTVAREVYDVTGAGDTVIAVFTLVASAGYDLATAAVCANLAAGIVVGKVGAAGITSEELLRYAKGPFDTQERKILKLPELEKKVRRLKEQGKTVVFTNGCFDLLHVGHIRYLQESRTLGDCLVVGLNSDSSVRRLKGQKRPLISEDERAHILSALDCVDYLILFSEPTPLKLIRRLKPHILVKGGDYRKSEVVGSDFVESYGGRIHLVPVVRGKSTTGLVRKIVERYTNKE